jgi:hypothetical protein
VYWRSFVPEDVNSTLVGPVTQAETAPNPALSTDRSANQAT